MKRRWKRIGAVVLLVVLVPLAYRVLAVYKFRSGECSARPRATIAPTYPDRLVVMTYNIQGHAALLRRDHIDEIAKTIVKYRPDVVAINEAHRWTWQARFTNQVERLRALTGMNVVFGPSFSLAGGQFGNAMLTRGTVVSSDVHALPGTGEPRTLLESVIRINGGTIDLYVTHLSAWGSLSKAARRAQLECIAQHLAASAHPLVLAGDINATPDSEEVRSFMAATALRQVLKEPVPTHRVREVQLDHIAVEPGWSVRSARVIDDGPSDHRPLIAELVKR